MRKEKLIIKLIQSNIKKLKFYLGAFREHISRYLGPTKNREAPVSSKKRMPQDPGRSGVHSETR